MPDLEWYLYAKPGTPIQGREFRLGNAVIRSRAFGVIHAAIQSYPQWGIGIWSAQRGIPALSVTSLRIKFYSSLNIVNCSIAYIYIYIYTIMKTMFITTMALWQLIHLGTWCTVEHYIMLRTSIGTSNWYYWYQQCVTVHYLTFFHQNHARRLYYNTRWF